MKVGGYDANSFERPLAALDLFILEERTEGDVDDVCMSIKMSNAGLTLLGH